MNSGFIYLHRKIKNSWIWKKPEYFQWFIHILFRANFKDKKILVGSELYDIKRGQFITSIEKLTCELNNCTTQKIRTFLKLLEKDNIISRKTTSKLTIITVCKYDSYQTQQQTNNKPITNRQQTGNKPVTTENKEEIKKNKDNNVNKKEYPDFFNKKLISVYKEFLQFRKEKKKTITKTQKPRFIEKLSKLSNTNPEKAEKILIQSIENGWQGIFELKTNNKKNSNAINKQDIENFQGNNPDRLKFKR